MAAFWGGGAAVGFLEAAWDAATAAFSGAAALAAEGAAASHGDAPPAAVAAGAPPPAAAEVAELRRKLEAAERGLSEKEEPLVDGLEVEDARRQWQREREELRETLQKSQVDTEEMQQRMPRS